uniref:chitinase n=1 Tax=Mastacembelus armatus TaxID=205130 RepID=A0A3Q3MYX0_9TELE
SDLTPPISGLCFSSSSKLVCHMTNWSQYRPSSAKFTPDNIDPHLCTDVIYTLATINIFNQITPIEWNDEQQYGRLNSLKNVNPALKTLLSVGGTVNGLNISPEMSLMYLIHFQFSHHKLQEWLPQFFFSIPLDSLCFVFCLQELSKAFADDARDNRKTRLLLSANVAAIRPTIDRAYEVNKISLHLDFINIMTYDYHGHWEAYTGHNSPLYRSSVDSGSHIHHNINSSVAHWLALGAPVEKLFAADSLGAPANGPADAGPYTRTSGFWAYYEICHFIGSATIEWISEQEVPYATYGSSWVGFDDKRSYSSKVQWMNANNLGGAHVWTLDMDDFGGYFCSDGPYPLINHLRMSMGFPPKPTTTRAPTTTRDPMADFCHDRPDGLYENPEDKNTYFQCFQGKTYLHRCQPGLIYWDSCKCCNWP